MTAIIDGEYVAEIVGQGYGLSDPDGTPYWAVRCLLLGRREADGRTAPCPRLRRTVRFPLPAGDPSAVEEALATLGLTADQIDTTSPAFSPLAGRRVVLGCRARAAQGRTREEWRLVEA